MGGCVKGPYEQIEKLNDAQKLILYTISQIKHGVQTETHLQKLIFMALNALGIDPERLGYYPFDYGPFSQTVKEISEDLTKEGYLSIREKNGTIANENIVGEIQLIEPKTKMDRFKIKEVADFFDELTRDEVVLHTYVRYPDFAKNSKIFDSVVNKRVRVAAEMYQKDKVTLSAGAELAGLSITEFRDVVKKYFERGQNDL